eukprot:566822-Pelagomonas_calceolata.AAC.7
MYELEGVFDPNALEIRDNVSKLARKEALVVDAEIERLERARQRAGITHVLGVDEPPHTSNQPKATTRFVLFVGALISSCKGRQHPPYRTILSETRWTKRFLLCCKSLGRRGVPLGLGKKHIAREAGAGVFYTSMCHNFSDLSRMRGSIISKVHMSESHAEGAQPQRINGALIDCLKNACVPQQGGGPQIEPLWPGWRKKMPSTGGSQWVALSLMHVAEWQA